jgi:hypothetical protein
MKFQQDSLVEYKMNDFSFIQKFAEYSYQHQRLGKNDFGIIAENENYRSESLRNISDKGFSWA